MSNTHHRHIFLSATLAILFLAMPLNAKNPLFLAATSTGVIGTILHLTGVLCIVTSRAPSWECISKSHPMRCGILNGTDYGPISEATFEPSDYPCPPPQTALCYRPTKRSYYFPLENSPENKRYGIIVESSLLGFFILVPSILYFAYKFHHPKDESYS